ncbi:MAG TPA: class I SAM-dependent methyltransferase [Acidimicrobiales bacterium]|nr:class I SAM-dependent methyltransferase [Acidimicrobiales bacterium]
MGNRWLETSQARSADEYDRAWELRAQSGQDVHGEADFVAAFRPGSVLDAGCGTGRVAVELARRGVEVVGVDVDPKMLAGARGKAPALAWVLGDLAEVEVAGPDGGRRRFDVVVLAGNVMIFLAPGQEEAVVANLAGHLGDGGRLVAGFQLDGHLGLDVYDRLCDRAGLVLAERWSTWDRQPFVEGGGYAVSVHRRP